MSEEELLRELDEKLRGLSVEGLWSPASDADMATYSKDPHTSVLPHVWKWPELYDAIQTVANMHGLRQSRAARAAADQSRLSRSEKPPATNDDTYHANDLATAETGGSGARSSA